MPCPYLLVHHHAGGDREYGEQRFRCTHCSMTRRCGYGFQAGLSMTHGLACESHSPAPLHVLASMGSAYVCRYMSLEG
ncbi:MAG: hypothetical protein KatS3mg056_3720 [Chloroflexus sp.]|nr:MAG: hypothetical protein KatS3mg056_3720 [Chloroflexus sp.]